jgi:hypothetical protein
MLLGDEYVLTDLDDMSFIQIEKGVIVRPMNYGTLIFLTNK